MSAQSVNIGARCMNARPELSSQGQAINQPFPVPSSDRGQCFRPGVSHSSIHAMLLWCDGWEEDLRKAIANRRPVEGVFVHFRSLSTAHERHVDKRVSALTSDRPQAGSLAHLLLSEISSRAGRSSCATCFDIDDIHLTCTNKVRV